MKLHDDIRQRLLDLNLGLIEDGLIEESVFGDDARGEIDELRDIMDAAELDRKYADLAETMQRLRERDVDAMVDRTIDELLAARPR